MTHLHFRALLAMLITAVSTILFADCLPADKSEVWEAQVKSCEPLRAERLLASEWLEPPQDLDRSAYANSLAKSSQAILVKLNPKRIREYQELSYFPEKGSITWVGGWRDVRFDEPKEFYMTGDEKVCARYKKNKYRRFIIFRACCDVLSFRQADCILGLNSVSELFAK
jgi:hypothetical protein